MLAFQYCLSPPSDKSEEHGQELTSPQILLHALARHVLHVRRLAEGEEGRHAAVPRFGAREGFEEGVWFVVRVWDLRWVGGGDDRAAAGGGGFTVR